MVTSDYKPMVGDVLFESEPSQEELMRAFTGFVNPSLAQKAMVKDQITRLENLVTPRLLQEAVLGSTVFYKDTGLTSAQFIGKIRAEIADLRKQL